ncbi:tRNA uracil 4-sulfurtransferase ThiI [Paramaledivibacter caminithermalis]|jgi:thiamine biosynthesis protein ThiI|uniref:Probable tRNA sulfurtransferase n=1 Tax=Paramaledivibacter caminithermalis (strain DSM 15212 / CIP 107654 / DViRD3) TaxID=1121301 RepID=A0A1M6Q1R8_PARC5|nr:tRNA uracil 4-sulfurtransferase ThiI [Paramaledivibacter caminithermalis]SHK14113.1 thiamine biosynthesis protein ThiI [Paramaledivibacter caminithermalis DSM 15212]
MERILIIRYGEISLKGLNRPYFENTLLKNIKTAVKHIGDMNIYKAHGRIYIELGDHDDEEIIEVVINVFGIVSVSVAYIFEADMDKICEIALEHAKECLEKDDIKTFKVEAKRANKKFPVKSPEISRMVGGYILKNTDDLVVDVHNPDVTINIEVRDKAYVYSRKIPGFGGMPYKTSGKAMLLLSGGIDSPVAGWLVAKRGVEIEAIHYHSYPFTSDRAKEKVLELARILSRYCGRIRVHSVNLLNIQKAINENCRLEEMTILSRRFMMKIAERVAMDRKCKALITGESIGQVASQTIESLNVTNASVNIPVFRPLIAMDKMDIIKISKTIDTYETSILPFEDCCTVFLPDRPVTKPRLDKILKSEELLDVEGLINDAINEMEAIIIKSED